MKLMEHIWRAKRILERQYCKILAIRPARFVIEEMLKIPPVASLNIFYAAKKLQKGKQIGDNIESLVDFVFNFRVVIIEIKPMQIPWEIKELLKIINDLKPKTLLEIGTAKGGTLFLFCRMADAKAKIISIDLPKGNFGGGYPEWIIPLYKSFAHENQRIFLIRANSHDLETLKTVKKILRDEKIDFLFIDGDHTYEGVKRDFEMYAPLVREGIIAFHDICPGSPEHVGGVPKFWKEIKNEYKHYEIIKDPRQGMAGIGVIYV